jgi:hypothetical protein
MLAVGGRLWTYPYFKQNFLPQFAIAIPCIDS